MIENNISKAIKESRWLSIEYLNSNEELSRYWIAIMDIDIHKKSFFVDAFNLSKISNETQGIIVAEIYFEKIKKTYIIDNTTYNQPEELIKKITLNIDYLDWLGFDTYNDKTLDYIHECMKHEGSCSSKRDNPYKKYRSRKLEQLPIGKSIYLIWNN